MFRLKQLNILLGIVLKQLIVALVVPTYSGKVLQLFVTEAAV